MKNEKKKLGKVGEDIASKYLENKGYTIIERNFSCKNGEIDIIAFDNDTNEIVFIEVKTRSNSNYGYPIEAVTKIKQKHIVSASKFFIYSNKLEKFNIRFDVIEILKKDKFYIRQTKNCQFL